MAAEDNMSDLGTGERHGGEWATCVSGTEGLSRIHPIFYYDLRDQQAEIG